MADAEDLKSSGDFSSWGFDSPPGHQSVISIAKSKRRGSLNPNAPQNPESGYLPFIIGRGRVLLFFNVPNPNLRPTVRSRAAVVLGF